MSIRVVCDNCEQTVEMNAADQPKAAVWFRLDGGGAQTPAHFCSWRCLRDYATAIVADEEKPAEEAPDADRA